MFSIFFFLIRISFYWRCDGIASLALFKISFILFDLPGTWDTQTKTDIWQQKISTKWWAFSVQQQQRQRRRRWRLRIRLWHLEILFTSHDSHRLFFFLSEFVCVENYVKKDGGDSSGNCSNNIDAKAITIKAAQSTCRCRVFSLSTAAFLFHLILMRPEKVNRCWLGSGIVCSAQTHISNWTRSLFFSCSFAIEKKNIEQNGMHFFAMNVHFKICFKCELYWNSSHSFVMQTKQFVNIRAYDFINSNVAHPFVIQCTYTHTHPILINILMLVQSYVYYLLCIRAAVTMINASSCNEWTSFNIYMIINSFRCFYFNDKHVFSQSPFATILHTCIAKWLSSWSPKHSEFKMI